MKPTLRRPFGRGNGETVDRYHELAVRYYETFDVSGGICVETGRSSPQPPAAPLIQRHSSPSEPETVKKGDNSFWNPLIGKVSIF